MPQATWLDSLISLHSLQILIPQTVREDPVHVIPAAMPFKLLCHAGYYVMPATVLLDDRDFSAPL